MGENSGSVAYGSVAKGLFHLAMNSEPDFRDKYQLEAYEYKMSQLESLEKEKRDLSIEDCNEAADFFFRLGASVSIPSLMKKASESAIDYKDKQLWALEEEGRELSSTDHHSLAGFFLDFGWFKLPDFPAFPAFVEDCLKRADIHKTKQLETPKKGNKTLEVFDYENLAYFYFDLGCLTVNADLARKSFQKAFGNKEKEIEMLMDMKLELDIEKYRECAIFYNDLKDRALDLETRNASSDRYNFYENLVQSLLPTNDSDSALKPIDEEHEKSLEG